MRIVYMVDYYQPQLGYGSYYIPRELVRLGHQVMLFTSDRYYPFPKYKETAGKILGQRIVGVGKRVVGGVTIIRNKVICEIFTRAIFGGHEQMIKKFRPDIVIVDKTAGYNQIVASRLKKNYNYKLISLDAHLPSGFIAEGNQTAKKIFYYLFRVLFADMINKTTDKFIAVQEETETIMRRFYGVKKKIIHIPLGTEKNLFKFDVGARAEIRSKYHLVKGDFVIIYTGKVIKEKGVDILFAALDVLCKKYFDVKLIIVGSGSEEYNFFCLSRLNKSFHNNVIWVGFQPASQLYKYFSAADVGVWPLQESMSMNDAAACSLPFIANNTIGARVRLSNKNALLYKKADEKDLADKIQFLYLNPILRKQMGRRGRVLIEKKLSWTIIAQEYISV